MADRGEEEVLLRRLLVALTLVLVGCTQAGVSATPNPSATVDIKRSKIDIAYSAFVDLDVHHATSKKALEAMTAALNDEATATKGKADFPKLDYTDVDETSLPDFKKWADAAQAWAARNPQLSADRIADVAIAAMISVSPDCHTSYINKLRQVFRSRQENVTGSGPIIPTTGTVVFPADSNNLQAKVLPNGVAYITFAQWRIDGSYNVTNQLRTALDKAVAGGAKSWLFDLRGNPGGNGADLVASWFLSGEPTLKTTVKTGNAGTASANKDVRLPAAYQLPMALVVNGRSASATEVFAQSLKENKRATLVGATTVGCLGAETPTALSDGSELDVAVEEYIGAVSGSAYNNKGVPPDVQSDDASAIDRAIAILTAQR